jgi:site-specific DNA-cytosine methylase
MESILSLYSGIGLFDSTFKNAGFCVVFGGDNKDGQHHNITKFKGIKGKFDGILITSPCQEFSKANRNPNYDLGCVYITEAVRIIYECGPEWVVFENVEGCPEIHVFGYERQSFFLNDSHVGGVQNRNRKIQFLYKTGNPLIISRNIVSDGRKFASCVTTRTSLSIPEMSRLQGFPNLELIGYSTEGAKRAIGNGVSFAIGSTIANAIRFRNRDLSGIKTCGCGCGEIIESERQSYRYVTCRKRIERLRTMPNRSLFYCNACDGALEVDSGLYGIVNCECVDVRKNIKNLYTPNSVELD